jgi:hypothetical protein
VSKPIQHYATPARPRGDLLKQSRPGEHVWIAAAVFRMDGKGLTETVRAGGQPVLDRENLATIEVGCYICEQAFEPRLVHRRCPGAPR